MLLVVKPSRIQGIGLFTIEPIKKKTAILIVIDQNQKITHLGSKINHSYSPSTNLIYDFATKCYYVMANRNLEPMEEITTDYRFTPDFIAKPDPNWV